ncbi:MAG TPA: hypothetical protein VEI26_11350 [Terriglobales bacterium]|nr:hypothetical protein [Terriglobales bacterium]
MKSLQQDSADGRLSHAVMNSGDLLRQDTANSVGATHTVGDQAHIRRADPQVIGYACVETKMQLVNAKKMLFIQLTFRFSAIHPHDLPPATVMLEVHYPKAV